MLHVLSPVLTQFDVFYCLNFLTAQSHTPALRVEGDSCVLLVFSSGSHPWPTLPPFLELDHNAAKRVEHAGP